MEVNILEVINRMPSADQELMPGVYWGTCAELFTPAYWKLQYKCHEHSFDETFYHIGENLIHEICACLLGSYGIKSELGLLAFHRLHDEGLLKPGTAIEDLEVSLSFPFYSGTGQQVGYRFANQKARYLAEFLGRPDLKQLKGLEDFDLRERLLSIKGIGLKTASRITRNWLSSERIAILDIHIQRAGVLAGFVKPNQSLQKNYYEIESAYLNFCRCLAVDPANLDSLIWLQLKDSNNIAKYLTKNLSCQEEAINHKNPKRQVRAKRMIAVL